MNTNDALAARIAVLENTSVVLAGMIAVYEGDPTTAIVRLYHEIFSLASERYIMAQPGPEKRVAENALKSTHRLYERLRIFITGK